MKRLSEQNKELKRTISDLEEENRDMKQEIEKLRSQATSHVLGSNEERMEEVNDLTPMKQKDEEWRAEFQDRTSKEQRGSKVKDVISKRQRREKQRERVKDATSQKQERKELSAKVKDVISKKQEMDESEDAARLKALTRARNKIEQARDLSAIPRALHLSCSRKVVSFGKKVQFLGSGTSSDKVRIY